MAITFNVDAILFDMDGTLVDSTAGVVGAWKKFQGTYHGIDLQDILSSSHGVRTVDNLKNFCGITDPEELEREAKRFEQAIVDSSIENDQKGIVLLPGVENLMSALHSGRFLPNPCWAICTSATREYATQAIAITGVPVPDVFVTAEDVTRGKPHPDPYLLGAKRCGVNPERCLVVEDTPAGIRSGLAAGCKTLGVVTTHTRDQMEDCKADWVVDDLTSVSMRRTENSVEVIIHTK